MVDIPNDILKGLPEELQDFSLVHTKHGRFGWFTDGRGELTDKYGLGCGNCSVGSNIVRTGKVQLSEDVVIELTRTVQEAW